MDLIINFYKGLDTLNLIIFWGIIIVIILLLIFSFVLINKNKKLKKIVAQKNKSEEEIPTIKEEQTKSNEETESKENIQSSEKLEDDNESQNIENENLLNEDEISPKYDEDNVIENQMTEETKDEKLTYEVKPKQPIEIPTKPYQRNVLREMSLSQTSPIGINRPVQKEYKKNELLKDLEESLNNEATTMEMHELPKARQTEQPKSDNQVKEELRRISYEDTRKTEIKRNDEEIIHHHKINVQSNSASELLNNHFVINNNQKEKNESEKYLEEVSRKLAEAEIPDEIERTNYELQQEEDAIISYKELMEKKDTIQTIDEEEAVISIEELMNKTNKKTEDKVEDTKLYNLSEEEENDNFIKELKQFRNDL